MSDSLLGGNAGAAAAGGAPSWVADLPEDLRGNPTLQSFKGNDWKEVGPALAKSFIETKKMTGQKAYDLPKDDWKPEQWGEWNRSIGVPESPDKYPTIDGELLKKTSLPPEVLASANKKFHELGLTPKQVKGLVNDWYLPDVAKGMEQEAAAKQEAMKRDEEAIRAEWGDKFDTNAGLVKAALAKFGSPELSKWAEENGAANNPALAKMLAKIGEQMLESSARGGGSTASGGGQDKTGALKEIEEIMAKRISDPAFAKAFENPKSPELARWHELHKIAYPQ